MFAVMKSLALLALVACLPVSAFAAIKTETIQYKDGDTALERFLAYDDANDKPRPGILLLHDWTGVQDYAKSRARQLAELGFVAFCADIYGKGVRPNDPQECAAEAGKYKGDRALFRRRVQAGLEILKKQQL